MQINPPKCNNEFKSYLIPAEDTVWKEKNHDSSQQQQQQQQQKQ